MNLIISIAQLICVTIFLIPMTLAVCDRRPEGITGDRSPVDGNFQILIEGNPSSYMPGQTYNISLACDIKLSFMTFTLAVENEDPALNYQYDSETLGHFEIIDIAETKFSLKCENMIESANTNKKSRIDVAWIAPKNNASGCVLFKAGLLQNRYVWFIDDGLLTKRFCPEEIDEINSQTPPLERCCACDEAKYEILLERKWSRNTHPKDFPEPVWRTQFSEVIGASHTFEYRFWNYGKLASDGLKALAEHGATNDLEDEIKQNISDNSIRTIIKAPRIQHRYNVAGFTLANVRVDPMHHMISLVSKIVPSPDWVIGVAGLELCLANCTWIESKVLNLYPWDVGTDAGPSYMSADQAQNPADVVRRMTSTSPSDVRSPFFDSTGQQMKPIATLFVTKKKTYGRRCENDEEENENPALECATHPWNDWSECNTRCGPGMRSRFRVYKDPSLAEYYRECNERLEQVETCQGTDCSPPEIEEEGEESRYGTDEKAECALSEWTNWTECSKSCGSGHIKRTREYLKPYAEERCQKRSFFPLEQTKPCFINKCGGSLDNLDNNENGEDGNEPDNRYNANYRQPQGGRWSNSRNTYRNQGYGEQEGYNLQAENQYDNNDRSNVNENNEETLNSYSSHIDRDNMYAQDLYTTSRTTIGSRPYSRKPSFSRTTRPPYAGSIDAREDNNPTRFGYNEENNEPKNENTVEEFCFSKPYPMDIECDFKVIVTKNFWLYDAEDRECKLYTSDNCDKNENRFNTLEKCQEVCLEPHQNQLRAQVDNNQYNEGGIGYGNSRGFGQPESQINPNWRNRESSIRNPSGHRNRYSRN